MYKYDSCVEAYVWAVCAKPPDLPITRVSFCRHLSTMVFVEFCGSSLVFCLSWRIGTLNTAWYSGNACRIQLTSRWKERTGRHEAGDHKCVCGVVTVHWAPWPLRRSFFPPLMAFSYFVTCAAVIATVTIFSLTTINSEYSRGEGEVREKPPSQKVLPNGAWSWQSPLNMLVNRALSSEVWLHRQRKAHTS